jgi:hypothetical protein
MEGWRLAPFAGSGGTEASAAVDELQRAITTLVFLSISDKSRQRPRFWLPIQCGTAADKHIIYRTVTVTLSVFGSVYSISTPPNKTM